MKYNIDVLRNLLVARIFKLSSTTPITLEIVKTKIDEIAIELRGYNLVLKERDRAYLFEFFLKKYSLNICSICKQTLSLSTVETHRNFVSACGEIDHAKVIQYIQETQLISKPFDIWRGVYTYKLYNAIQKYRKSLLPVPIPIPIPKKAKKDKQTPIEILKEKEKLEMIKLANKQKLLEVKRANFQKYLAGLKAIREDD